MVLLIYADCVGLPVASYILIPIASSPHVNKETRLRGDMFYIGTPLNLPSVRRVNGGHGPPYLRTRERLQNLKFFSTLHSL